MKKQDKSRHPDYYEAILQLRPDTPELLKFVKDELDRRGVRISKVIGYKNGSDLYLDNQKYARSTLGPLLKRKFGGQLIISRALFGTDKMTQKMIYRATVLFRLKE